MSAPQRFNRQPAPPHESSSHKPAAPGPLDHNARAAVVNRTHRVVREQALHMQQQKQHSRALWIPLVISSTLLLLTCYAAWRMLAEYDLTPTSIPDASYQLFVLLMWILPVTALALGLIWFKRSRGRFSGEATR